MGGGKDKTDKGDKGDKGKSKSKGEEKGGKDKGDKGDKGDNKGWKGDKGGKGDKDDKGKGKGKGKDKEDKTWKGGKDKEDHEDGGDKALRSQLSSSAPDFTPSMGNYGMYGEGGQSWGDWPAAPAAPPLWREYKDEDGVSYYHNAKTGLCQWEVPPELEPPKAPGAEKSGDGPRERRDRDGGKRDVERDDRRRDRDDDGGGGKGKGDGKGKNRRGKDDKKDATEFGPPGCNLFVFHLPDDWTDDDLLEHFAPHGDVISAKVMKELGTGRSRGFGFVSYEDRVSSATAIKKMQGYKILGKRLKVEFKKGESEGGLKGDGGDRGRDSDGEEDRGASGKKSYPDDERLIGYLRAISAKNVVQSSKEGEEAEDGAAADEGGEGAAGDEE